MRVRSNPLARLFDTKPPFKVWQYQPGQNISTFRYSKPGGRHLREPGNFQFPVDPKHFKELIAGQALNLGVQLQFKADPEHPSVIVKVEVETHQKSFAYALVRTIEDCLSVNIGHLGQEEGGWHFSLSETPIHPLIRYHGENAPGLLYEDIHRLHFFLEALVEEGNAEILEGLFVQALKIVLDDEKHEILRGFDVLGPGPNYEPISALVPADIASQDTQTVEFKGRIKDQPPRLGKLALLGGQLERVLPGKFFIQRGHLNTFYRGCGFTVIDFKAD